MAANFFKQSCIDTCNVSLFGICDDPPPHQTKAYISKDTAHQSHWIVKVQNPRCIAVQLVAIDHCLYLQKPDGTLESSCDCLVTHEDTITFIELKDRGSRGWLGTAKAQIENTIRLFEAQPDKPAFKHKKILIANKQRPFFQAGFQNIINELKENTGGYIADISASYTV